MSVFCDTYTSIQFRMINTDFTNSNTAALFNEAAGAADDDIKGYLAKRYDIGSTYFQTSTSAPPLLRKIGQDLTICYMIESLSRGGDTKDKRAEKICKRAENKLEMLRKGEMSLFDTAGALISPSSTNYAGVKENTSDYHNTFNEDAIEKWKVDANKLDDIEDERDV